MAISDDDDDVPWLTRRYKRSRDAGINAAGSESKHAAAARARALVPLYYLYNNIMRSYVMMAETAGLIKWEVPYYGHFHTPSTHTSARARLVYARTQVKLE